MGNFLNKTPESKFDQTLINQLKLRTLPEIRECITVLTEDYPDLQCLEFSQFEDVFCPILDDQEPFFLKLQNANDLDGTVDIYETLAAFVIFSGDKFENKVKFIFELFDFDHSKSLEMPEMVLTLQAASRALCKFVNITPPSMKLLEDLTASIFVAMDLDNSKTVSLAEFLTWIKSNNDLQNFLLKYAGMQTYDHMKKRFNTIFSVIKHLFTMAAGSPFNEFVEEQALVDYMKKEGQLYVRESDIDFIMKVCRESSAGEQEAGRGIICKKPYEHVMKAWSAFSAADVNNDNSIVHHELHQLLWVYEGQEPSEIRVVNEMKEMDKDKSGYIDRYEWINAFCQVDKNGKNVFRASLKELFEKYDVDNSGCLNLKELKMLTKEACKNFTRRAKDEETKVLLAEMIENLAEDILRDLDTQGGDSISWSEFRTYMEIAMDKFDQLDKFLNMHL